MVQLGLIAGQLFWSTDYKFNVALDLQPSVQSFWINKVLMLAVLVDDYLRAVFTWVLKAIRICRFYI